MCACSHLFLVHQSTEYGWFIYYWPSVMLLAFIWARMRPLYEYGCMYSYIYMYVCIYIIYIIHIYACFVFENRIALPHFVLNAEKICLLVIKSIFKCHACGRKFVPHFQ